MIQAFVAGALAGAMVIGGAKLAAKNGTKDVYAFGDVTVITETADAPD